MTASRPWCSWTNERVRPRPDRRRDAEDGRLRVDRAHPRPPRRWATSPSSSSRPWRAIPIVGGAWTPEPTATSSRATSTSRACSPRSTGSSGRRCDRQRVVTPRRGWWSSRTRSCSAPISWPCSRPMATSRWSDEATTAVEAISLVAALRPERRDARPEHPRRWRSVRPRTDHGKHTHADTRAVLHGARSHIGARRRGTRRWSAARGSEAARVDTRCSRLSYAATCEPFAMSR